MSPLLLTAVTIASISQPSMDMSTIAEGTIINCDNGGDYCYRINNQRFEGLPPNDYQLGDKILVKVDWCNHGDDTYKICGMEWVAWL